MEKSLPKGWVETKLGEVTTKPQYGWTTKSINVGKYKYLRTTDIGKGSIDWHTVPFCQYVPDDVEKYLLKENDILISRAGSIGLSYLVGSTVENSLFASYLIRFKPFIVPKFISYYLNSMDYWKAISDNAVGIAVQNINAPKLQAIPFPLPPLPEQERIVAKLDKLFHKIDGVKKRMDTLTKLKSKFFESIFYENAGLTTLSNFVAERNKRVGENWFEYKKIGVSAKDGIIDLDVGSKKTFEKYKIVEPGDIIYNTMRINIGSIAVYEGNSPAITSPDYVVFRVKNASKYLILNYLKSDGGKINISSVTTGSVRSRLYFKNLVKITFPEITSERHKSAESILKWFESSLAKIRIIDTDLLSKLGKAILKKAFKGELVPQLPTDGDAKDLLAEIMALKKETKVNKKKKNI